MWVEGRRQLFDRMEAAFKPNEENTIWVHCASLGEFEQGRPLIESIKAMDASSKILLTFFSPSGYEVRKNYDLADYVFYLPLDTAANAKRFVAIAKPKMAIFVKYEFWHHHFVALKANQIPIYSISAIFRPHQIYFKSYGGFYRGTLKLVDNFYVQNTDSFLLLKSIGIGSEIVGDTRFDRVKTITEAKKDLIYIKRFKSGNKLFVVGSSWEADIAVVIASINQFYLEKSYIGNIKTVIAPHEITPKSITNIQNQLQRPSVLYSQVANKDLSVFDVLIIDNIGMLSSIYAYADFAYIGGAFGKGLHNILEAATFGMPIFFGPKYAKFQEAVDLINEGGAFCVRSPKEFDAAFKQVASDEAQATRCSAITKKYVDGNTGATDKIWRHLNL